MLSTLEVRRRMSENQASTSKRLTIVPDPFVKNMEQIGRTSIDLRLGRWLMLLQQTKASVIDFAETRDENKFSSRDAKTYYIPFGQKFVLHPNRFVLATTMEWLSLPDDVAAYISGKSSLGRMGLIIETAAGIHPGFSGCITLELFNCGEVPIGIYPGMRVCQLFFHEVEGEKINKSTNFGGRRRPLFGSYTPDKKLDAMLKGNGPTKLF